MSKEDEIMSFLHEKVFDPVLNSNVVSEHIKRGTRLTIMRMRKRDAEGMVQYYWSAIVGTERSINFSNVLEQEGCTRFEDIIEEFRIRFNDNWLRN